MFKNKYGEVRSGWKIILTMLMMYGITIVLSIIFGVILGIVIIAKGGDTSSILEIQSNKFVTQSLFVLQNVTLIGSVLIMAKIFEKKVFSFIGLINIKKGCKELLIGLALGGVTITIVTVMLLSFGDVKLINSLSSPNISLDLLTGLITFIFVGFGEEIFGRGYCMSVLKQTRNKYIVIIVSSIIFALMHLGNLNVTFLSLINLFLAGVTFGYMFMKSNNIWMPIGFHITWNYFQGYIWGFEVSGTTVHGLYKVGRISDNIINGGAFGPEGGLAVTVILILTIVFVGLYYKDRKIQDFIEK